MSNEDAPEEISGRDQVFMAIDAGDGEGLEAILKEDPSLASAKSDDGLSALLFTLYIQQSPLTEILLKFQPDLSVFELSALGRIGELASLLLVDKSQLNAISHDGFSALHLACFFGNLPITEFLIDQKADIDIRATNGSNLCPIHSASAGRHDQVLAALIKGRADVNLKQAGGYTALMSSSNLGAEDNINALIAAGADINIKSDDGFRAADFAKNGGFTKLSERLREMES